VASVGNGTFDVRVVPNPTKGDFVIKGVVSGIDNEDINVEVTDVLGQVVYSGKAVVKNGMVNEAVRLNSSLANGMYMVNLHAAGTSKVFHIVLQQ